MKKDTAEQAENADDLAVITRILQGRTADFEILLKRYQGYVCKIVSGHLPYNLVAEQCHEIFIEAFRSLPKFDKSKIFRTWLAGIAVHRCHDYWRQYYRNPEVPLSTLSEDQQGWLDRIGAAQAQDAFNSREDQQEANEILQLALNELSPADRLILTLVHLEGRTVREAAEITGWSSINVKVRAYRAREKMRKRITALATGGC